MSECDHDPYRYTAMCNTLLNRPTADAEIDAQLAALELEMPDLQRRATNVFDLASAWARRHDDILASTPEALRGKVEARLRRIGIRWGMVPGRRMTGQFPALPAQDPRDES